MPAQPAPSPTPPPYRLSEHSLTSPDGTRLRADFYTALAAPAGAGRSDGSEPAGGVQDHGVVVVVHGYCEHRKRYRHVAEALVAAGYQVLTCDLRGHGESEGVRGYVERFSYYLDDLRAFTAEAKKAARQARTAAGLADEPERKPILLGHSMGALVALQLVLSDPELFRAMALSSPFLGIKVKVPAWKSLLGRAASALRPTLTLPNGLPASDISHDPEIVRIYETDPLITHNATARWFTEVVAAHADTLARASRIKLPTLMQLAGDDRIVDSQAAQAVYERLGSADKNLTSYPGLFHEIFNEREPDRQRVLSDLKSWLATR